MITMLNPYIYKNKDTATRALTTTAHCLDIGHENENEVTVGYVR